ncbi:MAG: cob(I)yrinic acid a,c-diamide adenosyltransferase [Planctomycetes bacterium]|jgi:cob(I)alamin adenosyltransferase|nr:cob(I)yrinic acid a,c-diamide adenosyltransferase [Planctomycetota bacterium]MDA8376646.1 cob(I)yrinic acid a,c-diamide adenosyltransferase [Planctomycetia bacterium]
MPIYTRHGDQGQTSLFDGRSVYKDDLRLLTYGTVDELNSWLGLAASQCHHKRLLNILHQLQCQLLDLGSDLATPLDSPNSARVNRIHTDLADVMEQEIDAMTAELPPLKQFILPGGSPLAAHLHVARTVCRRAERHLVTLMRHETVGEAPLIYLNRLSDLLFLMARLANQLDGYPETPWEPKK